MKKGMLAIKDKKMRAKYVVALSIFALITGNATTNNNGEPGQASYWIELDQSLQNSNHIITAAVWSPSIVNYNGTIQCSDPVTLQGAINNGKAINCNWPSNWTPSDLINIKMTTAFFDLTADPHEQHLVRCNNFYYKADPSTMYTTQNYVYSLSENRSGGITCNRIQ